MGTATAAERGKPADVELDPPLERKPTVRHHDDAGGGEEEPRAVIDATDGPPNLVQKIALAMAEADEVTKSSRNTDQGYNYASVEGILAATRLPLLRRGVALFQHPVDTVEQETTSRSGTKGSIVTVKLNFRFTDGHDAYTIEEWAGQGIDYGDKAYGKAYTNAIKTFIRAQWMLPTGDDPEQETPERGSRNGGPPAWAAPATAEQKAELVKVLTGLLHGNANAARHYAKLLADTIGAFPTSVAAWLCALPSHREYAKAGIATDDQAAQAASGEPDPEPPTASPAAASDPQAPPESVSCETPQEEPELEEPPAQPDDHAREPAGTMEATDENIEAHCSCELYGEEDPDTGRKVDDGCPIQGHGIPF